MASPATIKMRDPCSRVQGPRRAVYLDFPDKNRPALMDRKILRSAVSMPRPPQKVRRACREGPEPLATFLRTILAARLPHFYASVSRQFGGNAKFLALSTMRCAADEAPPPAPMLLGKNSAGSMLSLLPPYLRTHTSRATQRRGVW